MKSIIPYTKEISFGSKIAEITSMSLEHELNITNDEIGGNFIISGDYKTHEVSVNREPFLYKLPFSMELTDNIDLSTLDFQITDFSYDIKNETTVEVSIEFSVEALEKEVKEETREEIMPELKEEIMPELKEEIIPEAEEIDLTNFMDKEREQTMNITDDNRELTISTNTAKEETLKMSEETIINNINPMDDSYATYHIHVVKDGENVETICSMYKTNINLLNDYNDMANVNIGDKVIIPKEDE